MFRVLITQRDSMMVRKAQASMSSSEQSRDHLRLQAIIETAVDPIVTINERGIILSVNPATLQVFLYSEAELIGNNVSMLMPSPFSDEHDTYLQNYLHSGIARIIGIGREVVGKRKDGSQFPIHLAVSEVECDGRTTFTGILRDITDLKVAQTKLAEVNDQLEALVAERTAELEAAQAELVAKERLATLGQVSGGIAHEIRNPLNAVKTSAYFLLNAPNPSDAKRREHLKRIDRQVHVIDNVVTALSDVAKLPDARREALDINDVLRQTVAGISMPDTIELQFHSEMPDLQVFADPNQLPIVFRNLIRNARDAMPQGGQLTITTMLDTAHNEVAIDFRDSGSGIAEDELAKITTPLFTTKARGMGLGLAICKAILDKNKGRFEVESTVGVGSTFRVFLPRPLPGSSDTSSLTE